MTLCLLSNFGATMQTLHTLGAESIAGVDSILDWLESQPLAVHSNTQRTQWADTQPAVRTLSPEALEGDTLPTTQGD